MKLQLTDRKNALVYAFWSTVNKLVLTYKFRGRVQIRGLENIPKNKGFMLVANHSSRFDGLLVYHLINRPSNFLVHPNELKGFQGLVLRSMGAFPASTQFDLHSHIEVQMRKGEGVVIFPEGDVYRDGTTHAFKSGAARFALNMVRNGVDVPIVPVALRYAEDMTSVLIEVSEPLEAADYYQEFQSEPAQAVRKLTDRMYREVCHLRAALGAKLDAVKLFDQRPSRNWTRSA